MAYGADFKQFYKYVNDFKVASEDFVPFLKEFLKNTAENLLGKTRTRTPKDTGTLRTSWKMGNIKSDGSNLYIEIENIVNYASDVEYGHKQTPGRFVPKLGKKLKASWVNGRYMLTISMDEIMRGMNSRFQKAFRQWVEKRGIAKK